MIEHNTRVQLKEDFNLPKGVGQFDTVLAGTKGTAVGNGFGALCYVQFDSGQEGSVWVDRLIDLPEAEGNALLERMQQPEVRTAARRAFETGGEG